ncbi:phage portal protein [Corticibacterium sp. UT-5YL-CI-8]|nr:phage portal protein [Tianweitania sp. UT-5YL-CI-8]
MLDGLRSKLARMLAPESVRRFDGAAGGRRLTNAGTFGRLNAEIGAAGQTLASRAAYLATNQPYIANAVQNWTGALVGSGIRATSKHPDDAIRTRLGLRFDRFCETADIEGRTDFHGMLAVAARELVVAGEAFLLIEWDDDGFQLRHIPAEQIDRSITRNISEGAQDVQGVRFDARGRRVGYWIQPVRETSAFASWTEPVFVPAESVLHLMKPIGPGQVRGVSWLAPIILQAGEFDKLCDGLLMGVSVGAMFAGVITDENAMGGDSDPFDGAEQPSLEPGTMIRLRGGQKVTFANPQQASETTGFLKQNLHALAAGLGLPTHLLDNDLSGANYSSLRAGLLPFRQRVEAIQYQVFVPQILRPVWANFVRSEILAGNLAASEFDAAMAVEFIMPKPMQVDPAKDVAASVDMIDAGLMSRRQAVNELGWSVEELDAEIAADRKRQALLGLDFSKTKTVPKESAE